MEGNKPIRGCPTTDLLRRTPSCGRQSVGWWAVVVKLRAEVAELRRQLGQSSRNFVKPPSPDSPFVKPRPKSLGGRSRVPAVAAAPILRMRRSWVWSYRRCSTCLQ